MRRSTFFLISCVLTICLGYGQGKDNSLDGVPFKERIVTGGGLGLGFGAVQDFVSVSPVIGYSITKRLIAGTGLTYRYTNYKLIKPSIKLTDYGVSPFARFMVYKSLFVQTEYEFLNYEFPQGGSETFRRSFDSFLAGGGIIQPVGKNLSFYAMALYNFSYSSTPSGYAPYNSPWVIRAGINIGRFLSF
jgi:hypothetical protein